ncbi:hypothetical protein [Microbacterium kyungheense]|uniref:Phage portal protein BeeE n=1 Tax=Microbacterium kyungheense TaxID=1263636 RepID=A0A543EU72_9MICO|nr:hypothetical protein [Microbacterium kyungheense]TQM25110.1 phage portal protein BeeE [Microbacterium kyungheense]
MKFAQRLDLIRRIQRTSAKSHVSGIVSPWSDGELEKFVWSDILGLDVAPVTRKEAMSVPAVAAARHRIIQLADRPLRALDSDDSDVTAKHKWLFRTDTPQTPWERMAHTLDDWIFYPWSLWLVARGAAADGGLGAIGDARHVPYERWGVNDDGQVTVDDEVKGPAEYLLLEGPFDGLLSAAPETIRAAKSLERAWAARVRNPTPTVLIEEQNDGDFTKKEAKTYVTNVATALRNPDGAVLFVPAKAKINLDHAESGINVLTEARNAVRIDIANFLNLNASALDGAKPQSTLTYETQETEATELNDRMAFWTAPLEHALSVDSVVPRGTRVRFDFSNTSTPQTGTPTED